MAKRTSRGLTPAPPVPARARSVHRPLGWWQVARRAMMMLLGTALVGVGLEIFLVPNQIIDGGITGIAILTSHMSGLPLGLLLVVFNLPFVWLGYRQIGRTFTFSTMVAVVLMAGWVTLLHPVRVLTEDLLLAAVFGGVVLGIGVGTVIRHGGSLDGTEIVAIVAGRSLPFSVGEIIMFLNLFILGSAGFVFGWDRAMYSLIAYFVAYRAIDLTIEGLDSSKSALIITQYPDEIADAIIQRLGRGVTRLEGRGGYTGESKGILYCVVTRLEIAKLKGIVTDLDPGAFMTIDHVHEVLGGRFSKKAIH